MNALEHSRKYITYNENSPITGPFEDSNYPFVREPLMAVTNPYAKEVTLYKASQSLGTQILLAAVAYVLNVKRCNVYLIAQDQDKVEAWAKKKVRPMLGRIKPLKETVRAASRECIPITNTLWMWPNHSLQISGPSVNAQNSIDAPRVFMDEGHLYDAGVFAAFEDRMGGRWDRQRFNVTTAADEGHEVDLLFMQGRQNEWHLPCYACNQLIWPLWKGADMEYYNGERLFVWRDMDSDVATLETLRLICPHCQHELRYDLRQRKEMDKLAAYVAMNPGANPKFESFRYNRFAPYWREWEDSLTTYLQAIRSAKLGDLKPYENWVKKDECRAYDHSLPDFENGGVSKLFALGEVMAKPETLKVLTVDRQAGLAGDTAHKWALVTQWDKQGNSRRLAWRRLETDSDIKAMQLEFGVENKNVYLDCGFEKRVVFKLCAENHWYAVKGSDADGFKHPKTVQVGNSKQIIYVDMPYSMAEGEDGNVGAVAHSSGRIRANGALPPGWAARITMANGEMYSLLDALHSGQAGREFEIPADIPQSYRDTFPAFRKIFTTNKKTRLVESAWMLVKKAEHAWDCEVMALMAAIRAGYYPLGELALAAANQAPESTCHASAAT